MPVNYDKSVINRGSRLSCDLTARSLSYDVADEIVSDSLKEVRQAATSLLKDREVAKRFCPISLTALFSPARYTGRPKSSARPKHQLATRLSI